MNIEMNQDKQVSVDLCDMWQKIQQDIRST